MQTARTTCEKFGSILISEIKYTHVTRRLLQIVVTIFVVPLLTGMVYHGHGKALTAGLVDLVLVMLIAFRWGFIAASVASILSVASLDCFYMPPIFSLYEKDPQDWISSGMFLVIALTAGHFADGMKRKAKQTESEQARLERLYLTSRDIIMLDRRDEVGAQLTRLIANTFHADAVALWDAREVRMDKAGKDCVSGRRSSCNLFSRALRKRSHLQQIQACVETGNPACRGALHSRFFR